MPEQKVNLKINIPSFIVSFLLYALVYYFVSDSSDWYEYEARFKYPFIGTDLFFIWMTDLLKLFSAEYRVLFRIHIILSALLYALFTSKISSKGYLITVFILLTNFVAMGNMIRYYVAFPAFLCSFLYLYEKKYLRHVLLIAFALLNHVAILMVVLVAYLFFIFRKIVTMYPVWALIGTNIVAFICLNVAMSYVGEHFILYFGEEYQSSLMGGIFAVASSLLVLFLIISVYRNTRQFDIELSNHSLTSFLFIFSIASFSFVLISLSTQIFSNRFISPMLIVWVSFFCHIRNNTESEILQNYARLCLFLLLIIITIWTFFVPMFVLDSTFYIDEALILLRSISL